MNKESQDYKVEVLDNAGRPIILRPSLSLKDAIYWTDRIQDLGETAYIALTALADQNE